MKQDVAFGSAEEVDGSDQARSAFRRESLFAPVTPELTARLAAMKDTPKWAKWRRKRAVRMLAGTPVIGFMGPNGSGKSATACAAILEVLRGQKWECRRPGHLHTKLGIFEGYTLVFSTVLVTEPGTGGRPHPLYRRLDSWEPLLYAEHAVMWLDEVNGVAAARNYSAMPIQVITSVEQQRKTWNRVIYTGPKMSSADSTIRGITQLVVDCRSYVKKSEPGALNPWAPRRLVRARAFDAKDRESFDKGDTSQQRQKQFRLKPKFVLWWWGPGSEVFESYSTDDPVSRIGSVSDSGTCAHCGGTRTRPKCTCDH